MEDPKPDHDMRPRYKKIEKVLIQAEEMANKFVAGSCPRDLHPEISMPVARLLARVRLALAELRLMQVRALVVARSIVLGSREHMYKHSICKQS